MGHPTWSCERVRCPSSLITRIASGARLRMSVQKATDVEGPGSQRTRIPHGNMRAKLPNYIEQVFECKADGFIILARVPCDTRRVSLVNVVDLVLVEQDHPVEQTTPDESDQSDWSKQGLCSCDSYAVIHVYDTLVVQ